MSYQPEDELIDPNGALQTFQGQVHPLLTIKEVKDSHYVCDLQHISQTSDNSFRKSSVQNQVNLPFDVALQLHLFSVKGEKVE
jgi:hypothetical protein